MDTPLILTDKKNHETGFTLVELMIVIIIIAILSVAGLQIFKNATSAARDATRRADVRTIANALEQEKGSDKVYRTLRQSDFSDLIVPTDPGNPNATAANYCITYNATPGSLSYAGNVGSYYIVGATTGMIRKLDPAVSGSLSAWVTAAPAGNACPTDTGASGASWTPVVQLNGTTATFGNTLVGGVNVSNTVASWTVCALLEEGLQLSPIGYNYYCIGSKQ